MSRLNTSIAPYFNDFNPTKGYYSVLFQPKRAVQARELNELQSIFSSQFENLTDHFFKFGSMVKSGSVRLKNYTPYVRLRDLTPNGNPISLSQFQGNKVRGTTSGLLAKVLLTSEKDDFDPATIFVNYENSAIDGTTTAFIDGEELEVIDSSGFIIYRTTVRCPTCPDSNESDTTTPTGFGCLFAVEESSYYVHGRVVPTDFQMIILDKYETTPTMKVGFDIVQSFVTSQDDVSLNDNALGETNENAPGADRYQIKLVLNYKPVDDSDDENFVLLAKVERGFLQEVKDKPQYAELMNTLARRTYDESGDYTVNPFNISFAEHLASSSTSNDGFLPIENGGDIDKFVINVSPGRAYVRGREVDLISDKAVPVDKARDTDKKRSSVIRPEHGNFLVIELDNNSNIIPLTDVGGINSPSDFGRIGLYDQETSGGVAAGNQIGTCRVKNIELQSGFVGGIDEFAPKYALYIFDLQLASTNTILDVKGLFRSGNGNQSFIANIVPDSIDNTTKIYEPINNNLLYKLPFEHTSSIRDADNALTSNTSLVVTKKLVGAVNSSGVVNFASEGNETYLSFNSTKWIGGLQNSSGENYIPFDLTGSGVINTSPSTISINVGEVNSGKDFVLLCEVLLSNVVEKNKTIDTIILNNINGDVDEINLQVADAFRIISVTDVNTNEDLTENYTLYANVNDNYYGISSLKLKSGLITPDSGTMINVEVDYFQHSGNGPFFSVDSYNSIINDPDENFDYEDIPVYRGKDGTLYRMSDTLDFRPTINPDGTFNNSSLPVDNSNIIFDIEYFLPRIDLLCVSEFGEFTSVKGIPSLNPLPPASAERSMAIYTIYLDAYTFDVKKNIMPSYIDNRRYTMRDIGRLDRRITNLEYYVTFNLLEKSTSELSILDNSGNERFKNGFLVDNFKDYQAAETNSPDFKSALDTQNAELRPSFFTRNVPLILNESTSQNFVKKSDMALLPYNDIVYQEQPYSSKTVSVNPYFIFEVQGIMQLSPNMDVWKDVETQPDLVVDLDTGVEALRDVANEAGVLGTQWDNWQTNQSRAQTSTVTTGINWRTRNRWLERVDNVTTLTTTNQTQSRSGTNRRIESEISNNSLGTNVTSVNIIPFIRSVEVQFVAANMKPRTKLFAFFDGVDVTEDCRMLNEPRGSDLVSDANGGIVGVFRIPNEEGKRFFTGTRIFRLSNSSVNSEDPDELTTSAEAQFFSGGIAETQRETVLSVRTPQLIETEVRQQRSITTTSINTSQRSTLVRRFGDDPLAQSFRVSEEKGIFLTKIDLYFSAKSDDIPVWFQIRNMQNGFPSSVIVPYSEVSLRPEQVTVSDSGIEATTFVFEAPVYLSPDEEYCFVVGSSTEDYRIHVSQLGGVDRNTGVTISTQPAIGSMFKSQNDSTWTPEQTEDIKFRLHRAKFDTNQKLKLQFNNDSIIAEQKLEFNPIETQENSNNVRVYHKSHGLVENDKVKLNLLTETWFEVVLSSGQLVIGQTISGTNQNSFKIKDLQYVGLDGNDQVYRIQIKNLVGEFNDSEAFTGQLYFEEFRNPELLSSLGIVNRNTSFFAPTGVIRGGINFEYNGIPLSELSSIEHPIDHVDSMDSYIIQLSTPATSSGRTGGLGNYGNGNIQMDVFNLQAQFVDYVGDSLWKYSGIKHGGVGSNSINYTATNINMFEPNENVELIQSMKIAGKTNEEMFLGVNNKSLTVDVELSTDDEFISPMINLDSIGFTSITNRIDYNDCENYSVAPNAGQWNLDCDEIGSTARWLPERLPTGGTENAKYIMKPVHLKNPATNIKVYLDVLKHLHSDIEVWYRTLPTELENDINEQSWTFQDFDKDVVSESDQDYKEAEVTIPGFSGELLPEFKAFQIKIIMKSKNSAQPPKVKNFRAIAVT